MSDKSDSDLLKTVNVPGHPEFLMFDKNRDVVSESIEKKYRAGFYQAIEDMLGATQSDGSYARGYQDAVFELGRLMNKDGKTFIKDVRVWLNGIGKRWKDEAPGSIRVLPPELI